MADQEADRTGATWPLQAAKARFSELVKRAREEGPQHVSERGEPAVVIVTEEEFRPSIVDHIIEGEPWTDDLVDAINARPGSE